MKFKIRSVKEEKVLNVVQLKFFTNVFKNTAETKLANAIFAFYNVLDADSKISSVCYKNAVEAKIDRLESFRAI
ncbi:hypothetical protein [Streptococcus suis]